MHNKITLQVVGENGQKIPFTIQAENENYINSIIEVGKNNEISEADKTKLEEFAKRSGDPNIIENCDMTLEDQINYANYCGYDKFYKFKISEDKKYLEVTIKKASFFTPNPNLGNIKDDFLGGADDILVKEGDFPHGNSRLLSNKNSYGNYDEITLKPGDTIRIPVENLQFKEAPRNWLTRLIN